MSCTQIKEKIAKRCSHLRDTFERKILATDIKNLMQKDRYLISREWNFPNHVAQNEKQFSGEVCYYHQITDQVK